MLVPDTIDVLIVGAGPVGLTFANELCRHGVACRIIDEKLRPAETSRALGVFNRTLEVFGQMGIAEQVIARAQPARFMNIYAGGKHLLQLAFNARSFETPYSSPVFCSQVSVEHILTTNLVVYGVQIERGMALQTFVQDASGVMATLVDSEGHTHYIRTRWLIGCDGAHSKVRKQLQLPFLGKPDETWMVADVELEWSLAKNSLYAFLSPEGTVVAFPFPEGRRWRLLDTVVGEQTDAASVAARFTRKINSVYHDERIVVPDPLWASVFTIQQRHVPDMRAGNCFVVGDAAHVHSPASGQGMNTGIQDAFNLAWKLALVIRGYAEDRLLDSYSAEREPVAASVLQGAKTFTKVIGRHSKLLQSTRSLLFKSVHLIPMLHRLLNEKVSTMLSELTIAYSDSPIVAEDWQTSKASATGLAPGMRIPDIHFAEGDESLFQLIRRTQHTALLFTGRDIRDEDLQQLARLAEDIAQQHHHWMKFFLVVPSLDLKERLSQQQFTILDPQDLLHRRFGVRTTAFYLLRPDGYVGYRNQPVQRVEINRYIERTLGIVSTINVE